MRGQPPGEGGRPPAAARRGGADPHGRDAERPSEIPARGWWAILKRTAQQVSEDRVMTEAAGVTFYTLLAFVPALAALVSIYGLFADPAEVERHLQGLEGVIPGGGMEILNDQVTRIAGQTGGTLGLSLVISLGISLWSANQAMKALVDALNVVYEEKETRSFFRRTLLTLALTLGGIVFILFAMAGVVAVPVILGFIGLGDTADLLLRWARWPLLLVGVTVFLAVVYRYGPDRKEARWRWVSWGSAFAAVVWVVGSALFSWYVANFGSYNETYGSLGAVVGFMTWIWISAIVVLVGAELNAEMEHQTARDTTKQPEKPMGRRGAKMADTVAS
ncbi:YihY/virulence factor BrkB family protein [Crenalkalicoccus roseus]|uniref:YihY/virulence factor BrkB family protein n=1 Tax=Crenalkalicoccus roseus TaxID=1485588 RepID=UPI001F01526C|nr:YihY/virulence factor BrkB family protein [Crenalkalicoccus roseus]